MENKQFNAKAVVEAGLMAALIVVLMLLTAYVPILDMVGMFIVPIPVTILYMRHNLKVAIAGVFVSALIISMVFDPIRGILMLIAFGSAGITLGYCFKTDKKPFTTIALLAVILAISVLLNVAITALVIERTSISNFITQTFGMINEMTAQVTAGLKQTYSAAGASQEILDQLDKAAKMMTIDLAMGSIGLILVLGAVTAAFLDYVVSKSILIKLGYNIKKMKQFTLLYINSFAGALVVLPMALGMLLYGKKVPYGEAVYIGGQFLFQTTFLVIGVSVVFYFVKSKFRLSKTMLILIGIVTAFNPLFGQIYLFIGLADMIIDFRKINPNRVLRR